MIYDLNVLTAAIMALLGSTVFAWLPICDTLRPLCPVPCYVPSPSIYLFCPL